MFCSFDAGDLVMFTTDASNPNGPVAAFHRGAPNYYLSEDSYPIFETERRQGQIIFGRVIAKLERQVACVL
jgi:hypothetical protein